MATGYLGDFWTYDVVGRTQEKVAQKEEPRHCECCIINKTRVEEWKAALEKETSVCEALAAHAGDLHKQIKQSRADNQRLVAENKRLRESLVKMLFTLQRVEGGGVPQPAPPDSGRQGSGGGVAARRSPSAGASLSTFSTSQCPLPQGGRQKSVRGEGGGGGRGGGRGRVGSGHGVGQTSNDQSNNDDFVSASCSGVDNSLDGKVAGDDTVRYPIVATMRDVNGGTGEDYEMRVKRVSDRIVGVLATDPRPLHQVRLEPGQVSHEPHFVQEDRPASRLQQSQEAGQQQRPKTTGTGGDGDGELWTSAFINRGLPGGGSIPSTTPGSDGSRMNVSGSGSSPSAAAATAAVAAPPPALACWGHDPSTRGGLSCGIGDLSVTASGGLVLTAEGVFVARAGSVGAVVPAPAESSSAKAMKTAANHGDGRALEGRENANNFNRQHSRGNVAAPLEPRTPIAGTTLSITTASSGSPPGKDTVTPRPPELLNAFGRAEATQYPAEAGGAASVVGVQGAACVGGVSKSGCPSRLLPPSARVDHPKRRSRKRIMTEEAGRLDNLKTMSKARKRALQREQKRLFSGQGRDAGEGKGRGADGASESDGTREVGLQKVSSGVVARHRMAGETPTSATSTKEEIITERHRHVLECYMCRTGPEADDRREVFFCGNCPRKACLSCQTSCSTSPSDYSGWKHDEDEYGSFYIDPMCGRCLQSADDDIPSRQEALGMGDTALRESISDKDVRTILARFLDWLQGHDLAHFFVHDVDYAEYPEYTEIVKHPMNLDRMRARLAVGEYDDRRAGLLRVEEDLDWIVHNCGVFNGDESAISRCAKILERRAKRYWQTHLDAIQSLIRRGPVEGHGKHEPRRRRYDEAASAAGHDTNGGGSPTDSWGSGRDHRPSRGNSSSKRGTKRRLVRGASSCSESTVGGSGGRGSPDGFGSEDGFGFGSRNDSMECLPRSSSPPDDTDLDRFVVGNAGERSSEGSQGNHGERRSGGSSAEPAPEQKSGDQSGERPHDQPGKETTEMMNVNVLDGCTGSRSGRPADENDEGAQDGSVRTGGLVEVSGEIHGLVSIRPDRVESADDNSREMKEIGSTGVRADPRARGEESPRTSKGEGGSRGETSAEKGSQQHDIETDYGDDSDTTPNSDLPGFEALPLETGYS